MKFTNNEIRQANRDVRDTLASVGIPNPTGELVMLEATTRAEGKQVKDFKAALIALGFADLEDIQDPEDFSGPKYLRKADTWVFYTMRGESNFPTIQHIRYGNPEVKVVVDKFN